MDALSSLFTVGNLIIFLMGFFFGCYVCHERFRKSVNKAFRGLWSTASRIEMKGARKEKEEKNEHSRKGR